MKNNKSKELMQKFSIFFVLLVLIIVSSVMNPNFLSHRNITNIAVQLAVATILAYGEMVLIVSGLLDLSSGAVLALSGVLSVSAYKATGSMAVAFAVSIGVAVIFNMINALFVANFALPAFIVTLATQMAARGLALLYTSGQNILQIGKYAGENRSCSHSRYLYCFGDDYYFVYYEPDTIGTFLLCHRRQ